MKWCGTKRLWALLALVGLCSCVGLSEDPQRQQVGDFEATKTYLGDSGEVIGVRWVHNDTQMPVTLLRIQSVPQVYIYFNTPPVSDRGEPHAGEHLLLGKGTKGQLLSSEQEMSLIGSSASTWPSDVVYHWNCAAGKETFFRSVAQYLDALLIPDYTDEEIRREVCHYGIVKDQESGRLSLEEKGTVYNEMVSSYGKHWASWYEMPKRLWGPTHPIALSSGGTPEALRATHPHHIHEFHSAHYHLSPNMGMIVALPDEITPAEFLGVLSDQIRDLEATDTLRDRPKVVHKLPPAQSTSDRTPAYVPFPNANADEVGLALFAWDPIPLESQRQIVLLELFMEALANGERSEFYKPFMDRATREIEIDAADIGGWFHTTKVDGAAYLSFGGFPPRNANDDFVAQIRQRIAKHVRRVQGFKDGSAELADFNDKVRVLLTERERDLRKQLNSPPLFGYRRSGRFWLDHLRLLERDPEQQVSLTLAPLFTDLRQQLDRNVNIWKPIIDQLGLHNVPHCAIAVASPEELQKQETDRERRIAAQIEVLKKHYGVGNDQEAIRRYEVDYEKQTVAIEDRNSALPSPRLVDDVPLELDPSLELEPAKIAGVSGYRGIFDNMSFVEVSLSFPLDGVHYDDYMWLPLIPSLLTGAGIIDEDMTIPYDEMQSRLAEEIYSLDVSFDARPTKGRHELRLTASGSGVAETRRAIEWVERVLRAPWIADENLPRLRELVAKSIREIRQELGGSEENWVNNPADALRFQDNPLFLSISSYYTQLFHLARAEWLLMEAPSGKELTEIRRGLMGLVAADLSQSFADQLKVWEGSKDPVAERWLIPVARRIKEMLSDMPEKQQARDVRVLVDVAIADLSAEPGAVLQNLRDMIESIPAKRGARFVLTGSRKQLDAVEGDVAEILEDLDPGAAPRKRKPVPRLVDRRIARRSGGGAPPVHYGVMHTGGTSGIFVMNAAAGGLDEIEREALVDELAARVFTGGGSHSFFMQTWGAGLAYSNGLGVSSKGSRIRYYAERCPDLVETMKFVTGLVDSSEELDDPALAEYAVARAVTGNRSSNRYEARARAQADDMIDGDTPDRITRFRKAVLSLRADDELWADMKSRIVPMAGRVLPGVGPKSREVQDGNFVVIAPEKLLDKWEQWIGNHEQESLTRVWPRDFWITPSDLTEPDPR